MTTQPLAMHVRCEMCGAERKSTSGLLEAFESMLTTQGWLKRLVAKIGQPSYWGWVCPKCRD